MEKQILSGHRAEITCLDCNPLVPERGVLLSGSEDRTVRIWDTSSSRSVKCFHQCFNAGIEIVQFSRFHENIIYVASSDELYSFDVRKEAVLDNTPLSKFPHQFSDIDTMTVNHNDTYIALADDADTVYRIEIDGGVFRESSMKKFRSAHSNTIGTLAFSEKKNDLYSGGFDFNICKWDFESARPIKRLELTSFETIESSNQMFNPPFVTQLKTIPDTSVLVAAIGDGSVRFFSSELSLLFAFQAHNAMIVAAQTFGTTLITAGLDCKVNCWSIANLPTKKKKKGQEKGLEVTQRWAVDHGTKINYATSSFEDNKVFVCDTTNDISMYVMRA